MTETERTQARAALLLQLHAAQPNGVRMDALHVGLQMAGHQRMNPGQTLAELNSLVELGHVSVKPGTFNAVEKHFTLREAGRVALAEAGLI